MIPAAIGQATAHARSSLDTENNDNDAGKKTTAGLVKDFNLFAGGTMAVMTAFEPRVCRAPFECSWPKL